MPTITRPNNYAQLMLKGNATQVSGSATYYAQIYFKDKDNINRGLIQSYVDTQGVNHFDIGAYNSAGNSVNLIRANVDSSGTFSTYCATPTDTTSTSSQQITTVGWSNTNLSRVDLSNSPYTTNRILEIPQDIKLELNNGTLTLKAGSKVYVPNGFESNGTTPKFDVVTIANDIVVSITSAASGIGVVTVLSSGTAAASWDSSICSTGTTDAGNNTLRYRSDTNLVVRTDNSGGKARHSFPIAILNQTGTTINSIDQIFNGFGYIGSTVFVLPGVKVSLCNGLNDDGTYKHIELATTTVLISNNNSLGHNSQILLFKSNGTTLEITNAEYKYDAAINRIYRVLGHIVVQSPTVIVANFDYDSTGNISSLQPYSVDSVANSNMSNISNAGRSFIAGQCALDTTHQQSVTLLASGQGYTAPQTGVFALSALSTAGNYIGFYGNGVVGNYCNTAGQYIRITTPIIQKGQKVYLEYSSTPTIQAFVFVPLQGEN